MQYATTYHIVSCLYRCIARLPSWISSIVSIFTNGKLYPHQETVKKIGTTWWIWFIRTCNDANAHRMQEIPFDINQYSYPIDWQLISWKLSTTGCNDFDPKPLSTTSTKWSHPANGPVHVVPFHSITMIYGNGGTRALWRAPIIIPKHEMNDNHHQQQQPARCTYLSSYGKLSNCRPRTKLHASQRREFRQNQWLYDIYGISRRRKIHCVTIEWRTKAAINK